MSNQTEGKEKLSGYDILKAENVRLRRELDMLRETTIAKPSEISHLRFTLADLKLEMSLNGPTQKMMFRDEFLESL